ncbi:MAG: J domain-containing protein [Vulcanococcus sp.]
MGFDPRRWSDPPRQQSRVTSNVDALLAENEALRREVRQLRRRLEQLQQQPAAAPPERVTRQQVERWGQSLTQQKGWSSLRLVGLEGLIDALNRRSFHAQLSLQERLDRLLPGLGSDLFAAMAAPLNKQRCAVLAAFALYGVSAIEWLDDDPQRVVQDLRQRQERSSSNRRTRSDHRTHSDHRTGSDHRTEHSAHDPRRLAALEVLGLRWGASRDAIKAAHRRLVKQHHPDLGGSAEAFRRVNEAYQQLVA